MIICEYLSDIDSLFDVIDFGKYYINSNLWDYKDKWEYKARILGVAPEQVIIEDEDIGAMYGLINNEYGYADRFNITDNNKQLVDYIASTTSSL